MQGILGIAVIMGMVFGGYLLAGGKMTIIIKALPFEFMMIGGAAAGAFILGNKPAVVKQGLKDFGLAFKGGHWGKDDYRDLLCMLFETLKLIRSKGLLAIEEHIENPEGSSIFSKYPKIVGDHFAIDLICDTLRMITMSLEDPYQVEDVMKSQIDKHHHESHAGLAALQGMSDGFPAIGIVAAVLGVIKTMGSIDSPPPVLGKMIGGALVGTFLGIFLSYCMVGPIAAKANATHEEDAMFYKIIMDMIVAHLKGCAPQVAVEIGRGNIPTHYQPNFAEMEEALNAI